MDMLLQPFRPRFLSKRASGCDQLQCGRLPSFDLGLARRFTPVGCRISGRILRYPAIRRVQGVCKSQGSRRCCHRRSIVRIPLSCSDCGWERFGCSQGDIWRFKAPERSAFAIAHFEQDNRSRNEGNATNLENEDRPPFNLDLAVVLAGFAFEAYNTPAENVGVQEKDAGDCETTFLAQHFLREVYDGQVFVNLKKGMHFPGLDFWGTSDPYVVLQIGGCEAQSKVIWATKDPIWNEELKLNVQDPTSQILQVAAWDANVITAHRRMGNTGLSLKDLSDGKKHEVELNLGGMGGGGAIQLEVQYKSFAEMDAERSWWSLPSLTDLLHIRDVEDAYKKIFGGDGIKASDFVRSTLGSLPFLLENEKDVTPEIQLQKTLASEAKNNNIQGNESTVDSSLKITDPNTAQTSQPFDWFGFGKPEQEVNKENLDHEHDDDGDYVRAVVQAVGKTLASIGVDVGSLAPLDKNTLQAEGETIRKLGSEFQSKAEANYVDSGLAIPNEQLAESPTQNDSQEMQPMFEQLEKASKTLLQSTENFLGLWAMVAQSFPGGQNQEDKNGTLVASGQAPVQTQGAVSNDEAKALEGECEDDVETKAKREMFQTAESAVEAWAMLATSLGGQSFVKSEFEKMCFLENRRTDTEVAIWRDVKRRRLVVAFRGTEQTKWKDLSTDINVIPVAFNPERIGGDFKEEVMVHGGFLNAYDSVRRRLMTLLQASLGVRDIDTNPGQPWQVYSTGHSLGGALATLFALELSSSKLAKKGHVQITMYNFGSPRVGNKRFADVYNKVVKDSWRIVNHRDIIPTVPRLMGYCHVAQPIYLSAGALTDAIQTCRFSEVTYS
ncbi:uncharacterized protein [Physcomitrium patens]|uniref:uncharacterized protein isoform X3 n=1 Tax=Physcomitrium patens TaxID=3218 RepID=UPI000D1598CA|nr:uncharacterized protein LOC112293274 isoform X3 [Physcomitrium patens]|eukprot:XP_024398281.1 uncharacterized protein LOC112293274 isoform X3 [Physcomitrella patens]